MTDRERDRFEQAFSGQFFGTATEVADALGGLVCRADADEVFVTTSVFDHAERLDTYGRLAELAGIRPGAKLRS
jgi:hypothetical protein